jgi:hypothetical protein
MELNMNDRPQLTLADWSEMTASHPLYKKAMEKESERKKKHSDYNIAWRAKHRREGTAIARRIKDKENYYANRAKETMEGYCRYFLNNIKSRCKRKGLAFNLTLEDLVIPEFCPVLGIPLIKRQGKFSDNSPSVDRIIPSLGYVKGNIAIMSYRANRIKCHASLADLKAIVAFMEANTG